MPTYPPKVKITLIINNNSSLAFGMGVDYFVKSSLRKEKARNFMFIYLSERGQPNPIFPTTKSPRICIDLRGSLIGGWGGGKLPPVAPPPPWARQWCCPSSWRRFVLNLSAVDARILYSSWRILRATFGKKKNARVGSGSGDITSLNGTNSE